MKKKTSVLVLTGAITISNIGLTTSFADVNDETLLIQEKSTIVHSKVSIETDGSARIAGQDGQLGTADDVFVRPGANGQAPHVDQFGNVTVPTGGRVELPDGNIVWDTGNDQSIVVPAGTVITPNGNGGVPVVNADGSVKIPDGSIIVLPIGSDITLPSGSSVSSNGDAITAGGVTIKADGTTIVPGADGQIGTADDVIVKPLIQPDAYIELPSIDEFGNVTLPIGGYVELPDGTIIYDRGNEQSIIVPGGTVITPNGNGGVPTVNPDGTVNVPEGSMVVLPNGDDVTPGSGSVVSPNGSVTNKDGSIINPDGSITGGNTNKPGEDVNKPSEDINKPGEDVNKPSEDTNKPGENVTKPSTNPNTGDRSVMGMLVVGSMALLALVKNLKIKDKLFLK